MITTKNSYFKNKTLLFIINQKQKKEIRRQLCDYFPMRIESKKIKVRKLKFMLKRGNF